MQTDNGTSRMIYPRFPRIEPGERLGSNEMGQATQMDPPGINIEYAPASRMVPPHLQFKHATRPETQTIWETRHPGYRKGGRR